MIDRTSQPRNNELMKNNLKPNPVSDQLKQDATVAPFVMEKQNYLMAAKEIDRLHMILQDVHAYIQSLPDHVSVCQVATHIRHILQAHEA